jgi:hypothetical protein
MVKIVAGLECKANLTRNTLEKSKLSYLLELMVRAGLIIKQLIDGVNHYAINLNHRDEVYAIIRGQSRLVVGKDGKPRVEKVEKKETNSTS